MPINLPLTPPGRSPTDSSQTPDAPAFIRQRAGSRHLIFASAEPKHDACPDDTQDQERHRTDQRGLCRLGELIAQFGNQTLVAALVAKVLQGAPADTRVALSKGVPVER